jgi:hypothetical protein
VLIPSHSEVYGRVNSEARNGTELREKIVLQKILLQQTEGVFSYTKCCGTEFREFASIFVSGNGITSCFLFHGMVRNIISNVCIYICSTERNQNLLPLPRNGSERNSESMLIFVPRYRFPSMFLLCGKVRNGTQEYASFFCFMVQNSEYFSPLRNSSETEFREFSYLRLSCSRANCILRLG